MDKIIVLGIERNSERAIETQNHLKDLGFLNVDIYWGADLKENLEIKKTQICMYNAKKILDMNRDLNRIIYCEDDIRIYDPIALKGYLNQDLKGIHRLVYLDIPVRKDANFLEPHYKLGSQMILFDNEYINKIADYPSNKSFDTFLNREYYNTFAEPTGFEYIYDKGESLHNHHRKSDYIRSRNFDIKIHQIFGLLGDTKMNDMFEENSQKYKDFCWKNGYQYIFWSPEMCDNLIEEYLDYKELYYSVKYPIMKVDIIRFIILHKYGGLYADLDTKPKCKCLKSSTFIIANPQTNKNKAYEMEVIQSVKGHPYLLGFLDYVKTQIKEKDKIEVYEKWKCRYVYQTTGPYSLSRYLKHKEDIDTYIINNPSYDGDKSLNIIGNEDFISHISCSYKDTMKSSSPSNDLS